MAKYIQATMSAGVNFRIFADAPRSPIAQVVRTIHVNGGANVRDKNSIFTPNGMMTEVSDEDYALLEKNSLFNQLRANGYIVVTNDHHLDVKDNKPKDKSAQKTPDYYRKTRAGHENPVPSTEPVEAGEA